MSQGTSCHGSLEPSLDPWNSVQADEILGQEEGKWPSKEEDTLPTPRQGTGLPDSLNPIGDKMLHKKGQPGP